MSHQEERWAIIGGGMLGLSLARRLQTAGRHITVFEGADSIGGLAGAWTIGDVTWDRHYHVTLLSDLSLRALLGDLGLEAEMRWVQTRTGFYTGGKLHSMSNAVEFLRFPPLHLIGKLRLAATILIASRIQDGKALEQIPVSEWLIRLSGKATFEKIWLPLLRAKLGENYRDTSAAFIWATIQRMYAARRSGLKKEMFGYLPGGYARILSALERHLAGRGVSIRTGHVAQEVADSGDGRLRAKFAGGHEDCFDRVIVTLPAVAAARICAGLPEPVRDRLTGIRYQGVLCASVLLRKPLAGFYVTNITDDWVPFTAVIEMSALVDRAEFKGNALVYLPKYLDPKDSMFDQPDDEIRARFLGALYRMYPGVTAEDVLAFQVSRVRQVVALPTLGYSGRLPPVHMPVPGLHVINSAHIVNGTLNVNETIQLADRAAAELNAMPGRTAARFVAAAV